MAQKKNPLKISVKDLNKDSLRVLASDMRADILSACLSNGGHLSSNLGVVELTLSMVKNLDPEKNDILFDVGHQSYAYKMLTGRDIQFIRKTNGVAPFNLREESPYDIYSNGHAGDCLSTAIGIAHAKLLAHDDSYTVAFIGDASIENGISYEGLDYLATHKELKNLIVVLNDNGMAISKNKGAFSSKFAHLRNSRFYFRTSSHIGKMMSKRKFTWKIFLKLRALKDKMKAMFISPTIFETFGIKYIGPFDGHDFDSLDLAFEKAKITSLKQPVILHILTKKGYGYPEAMKDENGSFHGVKKNFDEKEIESNSDFTSIKEKFLLPHLKADDKIVLITPAMEKGSHLEECFKLYPERCFDTGISEEHAIVMASGLSLMSYHPIVDIYSTFLQRGYDEIMENISRNKVPCLFFVERCGLVGEDGSSHHGIYDVAMIKTIPYARVYMPFDRSSLDYLYELNPFEYKGPTFYRFSKGKPAITSSQLPLDDVVIISKSGEKTLVIAIGSMGLELLNNIDISCDKAMLLNLLPSFDVLDSLKLDSYDNVILYDPYSTKEGSSSYLSQYLLEKGFKGNYSSFAIENDFVTFGSNQDLYHQLELDVSSVIEKIRKMLKE